MTSNTTLLPFEKIHPDGDGGYRIQRRPGESGGGGGNDRQMDATILPRNGAHGPAATGAYVRRVLRNEVVCRLGDGRVKRVFCPTHSPAPVVRRRFATQWTME